MKRSRWPWAVLALVLALAGCRAAPEAGVPIEVRALDELRFDPDQVAVGPGDTVTFRVVNDGELEHEFVVGTQAAQDEHDAATEEGEHDHGGASQHEGMLGDVHVAPGETRELTVTFEDSGELVYACHVDGHYQAGMVGTIVVR